MAKHIKLAAEKREKAGKGVSRALRRENRIPAVIYGDGKEPVTISLPAKDVNVEYNKGHMSTHLADIDLGGEKHMCLARDIQLDPVKDFVLHVDFLRVTPKTKINVNVPVHFINEEASPGLDTGGVLNIVRHEVELICPATHIPEFVEVDLTGYEQGDSVKSDRVALPKGATFAISDRDFTFATIVAPRRIIDDEETGGDAEVVGDGEAAEADE
ncbi:MAG: 50S ribosomal protein L25/general stress protein Ctc [Alphaproteobacteria bacterium]|nr:50S ribosomal protein L25/general stress protein Ctc [Alphaproteobacteria bacterium]